MSLLFIGFVLIFLLGMQQQHIEHKKHLWSAITSYLIAGAQVLLIKESVASDWAGVMWLGTGGALGASASMIAHRMLRELSTPLFAVKKLP